MDKQLTEKAASHQTQEPLVDREIDATTVPDATESKEGRAEVVNNDELPIVDEDSEIEDRYPKSNRFLTAVILSILGAGAYIFDLALNYLDITLPIPANYVYDFYYITLTVPAQTFPKVWSWLAGLGLIGNADVDKGVAVIGMLLYSFAVLWLYAIWVELMGIIMARLANYDRPDILGAFKAYVLPALITTLYFLIIYVALLYGDTSTFDY